MVGAARSSEGMIERKLPPTLELAVATLVLVIVGGTFVAAYLPRRAPFAPALVLLAAAVAVLLVNLVLLSRVRAFAWRTFFLVGGWTLLAYIVIAGMLEWVFVADGTPGDVLALLSGMLAVYAIDIPLLFAFAVARYQPPANR
jgi:hypothetical protein